MKSKSKVTLACALAAGLTMLGAGKVQALIIDDELVIPFNAQLTMSYANTNGKIQKVRITSKDLVNAISSDFAENFSGDQIVQWDGDYYLLDKHNNLTENLTDDDVFYNDGYEDESDYEKDGKGGSYKYSEAGYIYELEFASDGYEEWEDSSIGFYNYYIPYTYTETSSASFHGKYLYTYTEKDSFAGYGHDYSADDLDADLPISGTLTLSASGIFPVAP